MTQAIAKRIVNSFETLGLTPEQISDSEGVALAIVKSCLFQSSSMYRKEAKKTDEYKFTKDECREMRQLILQTARESEDEHLAHKARVFVINDYEGRLDTEKNVQQLGTVNVINFNNQHANALKAIERTKQLIDVPTNQVEEIAFGK